MGRSFFEFGDTEIPKTEEKKVEQKAETLEKNLNEDYKSTYDKFSKMPQDELMQNLFQEVSKQKQDGTFDIKKLEKAVDNLSPMLNNEQKKNIKELLNKIK